MNRIANDGTGPAHPALYRLNHVVKTYGSADTAVTAVDGMDLDLGRGEFAVVAGPSGSGKSTLLLLLGALDRPSAGTIEFEGRDLARLGDSELADLRRKTLGFVFQQFNLIPTLTAAENVEAGLAPLPMNGFDRRQAAARHLDAVGLEPRAGHLPTQLSGGEQQRVAIARALARSPRVVLADEPTGNLDTKSGEMVIDLLASLHQDLEITLVLVTHDQWVADRADRVLRLDDGRATSDSAVDPTSVTER
jgi:putative ABC transport system ATP-binding protein